MQQCEDQTQILRGASMPWAKEAKVRRRLRREDFEDFEDFDGLVGV